MSAGERQRGNDTPPPGRLTPSARHPLPTDVRLVNHGRALYAATSDRYEQAVVGWLTEELASGKYNGLGNPHCGAVHLLCRTGDPAPIGFAVVHGPPILRRLELVWIRPDQRRGGLGTAVLASLQLAYPSLVLCPPVSPACQRVADRLGIATNGMTDAQRADQAVAIANCPAWARRLVRMYGGPRQAAQVLCAAMRSQSAIGVGTWAVAS